MLCNLSDLRQGEAGEIVSVTLRGSMRRRVQDLGFLPGATVNVLLCGFRGGICAYGIQESVMALRRSDAAQILVNK